MASDATIDFATRITGATADIAGRVTGAIREAARATGVGFDYLLNTAIRESNLDPNAKSPNSSATGLFQFLDQSWLSTLKTSGPSLGYGRQADAITRLPSGRYAVTDPAMLREIMALRKDPTANAVMAGAFANSNAKVLSERLGRKPTDGELYIAHFLGASGAVRLISGAQTQPNTPAASMFPKAAAANAPIFYDRSGNARTLAQTYGVLVAKHDVTGATRLAQPAPAAPITAPAAITAALTPQPVTRATPAPVPAAPPVVQPSQTVLPATVASFAPAERAPIRASGPIFQTLFQTEERGAVAPIVRELWGPRHAAAPDTTIAVTPVSTPAPPAQVKPPLNLFQFLRPEARGAA